MKFECYVNPLSYIISVSVETGSYRHLRISGSDTLDNLASAILGAFDFEKDHLYSFFMDNRWWSDYDAYHSPFGEEPPFADETMLSRLNLQKGQCFKFLFDYGDEWRFQCKVLQVLNEETPEPELLKSKGASPEQYPQEPWETEEDTEEDAEPPETLFSPAPDETMEAAFQFRSDKLWKKLNDHAIFAVQLSSGEIGYCSILGALKECIALTLYIGDLGFWSLHQICSHPEQMDESSMLLTQNCLQLGLDNKSDLPEEVADFVAAYAKAHGINLRGKKTYPNCKKLQSYYMPGFITTETDFQFLTEALRAAHDVAERLQTSSVKALGLGISQEATIPLLTPDGNGFQWAVTPVPEIRPFPYPQPSLSSELAEAVSALPKKGTLEAHLYISLDPIPDETSEMLVFPPLLVIAGSPAKLNTFRIHNICYPEQADHLLEQFAREIIETGKCPNKILTEEQRSYAFFSHFCEQCGIMLDVTDSLPKVKKVVEEKNKLMENEKFNEYICQHILPIVETMETEDLQCIPEPVKKVLAEMLGKGVLSAELEEKLKKIL